MEEQLRTLQRRAVKNVVPLPTPTSTFSVHTAKPEAKYSTLKDPHRNDHSFFTKDYLQIVPETDAEHTKTNFKIIEEITSKLDSEIETQCQNLKREFRYTHGLGEERRPRTPINQYALAQMANDRYL